MAIIVSNEGGGGDFKSLEPGTYIARCVSIWSIGTQYNKWHDTWKPQIILRWEVPEEKAEDGKPATICGFFTLSLHEKSNLYKSLVAWRGKKFTADELARFDLETILGVPGLLTVTHTEEGRQKVSGITKVTKGTKCPAAVHELESYSMADDPGGEKFNALPEWVQNQLDKSRERMPVTDGADNRRPAKQLLVAPNGEEAEDDIPF